jgi:hypothetical protein
LRRFYGLPVVDPLPLHPQQRVPLRRADRPISGSGTNKKQRLRERRRRSPPH